MLSDFVVSVPGCDSKGDPTSGVTFIQVYDYGLFHAQKHDPKNEDRRMSDSRARDRNESLRSWCRDALDISRGDVIASPQRCFLLRARAIRRGRSLVCSEFVIFASRHGRKADLGRGSNNINQIGDSRGRELSSFYPSRSFLDVRTDNDVGHCTRIIDLILT